ncbi:general secretion pathway protein, partial [Escherichia sp. E3659]
VSAAEKAGMVNVQRLEFGRGERGVQNVSVVYRY